MSNAFYDSSAAVKHYRAEAGTSKVDGLLAATGSRSFLSVLGVVEVHSALARLVRVGHITPADFHLARGRFLADIAGGLWQVVRVKGSEFQQAQLLLVKYGLTRGLRTLDAIQLAAALGLQAALPLDAFLCADANLCHAAAAEGLTVVNPEVP
jgi:predicted nucleic acid-binding protein